MSSPTTTTNNKRKPNMKHCTICGKSIVLIPSATERAKKYGGKPSDYTSLFTSHSDCQIDKRNRETSELIRARGEFDRAKMETLND